MDVTARHIHEKQFHDAWRGYNQEEVDDFLDRVADQMNRLERENFSLQDRLRELDQMVAASRSTEDMLKKTLVTAQQAAEEAIATAKAKAEELVAEAEARAHRANEDVKHRVATAEEEVRRKGAEVERQQLARRREIELSIERLEGFEAEIKKRLKLFLEQQLGSLDALTAGSPKSGSAPSSGPTAQPGQVERTAPAARPSPAVAPRPAQQATAMSAVSQATAPQAAVATEEPQFMDLRGGDETPQDFDAGDNGDARKRPLRAIFRRDGKEEDWSSEEQ